MRINQKYLQILILIICVGISPALFSQSSTNELNTLISKNISAIGLTKEEAANYIINSSYKDAGTGIEYVYIQQTYKDIKVFNVVISLAFKKGNLLYSSGKFLNPLTSFGAIDIPVIDAGNAVSNAARHLNLKPASSLTTIKNSFKIDKKVIFSSLTLSKRDIETELLWVQDDSGKVHLSWNVNIDVEVSKDWWNVRVDAITGEIINKDNWTVHEKFLESDENLETNQKLSSPYIKVAPANLLSSKNSSITHTSPSFITPNVQNAVYRVVPFPLESRNFGDMALENNPWLKAGAANDATTYGWHFDGAANYSITRGNNVFAYDDSANTNNPGRYVTSSTQPPFVNFDVSPNFLNQPFDSTNRNFGIVNLFYWNNIVHDISYQYGFNESAGNFQADNLGRGGTGSDFVRAEAQDGSGTDNANFTTPSDGASGRMQMFLFSAPPELFITAPNAIARKYTATESQFSTNNKLIRVGPVSGQLVFYNDGTTPGTTHEACDSSKLPGVSVNGKIALISRGTCPFTTKMRAAQNAGAIGVIIVNNVPGPPIGLGGTDNLIRIPGIMISQDDGATIANELPAAISVTMSTGILLDGDIDNGVVTHEFGHGISNRLTGGRTNSSCLSNAEQAGEGWSDYLALMVNTNWQNAQFSDGDKPHPLGTYALGQDATGKGIRRVPYSTNMLIDTLTYKSMDGNTAAGGNGEVHNIGEIWCSALWDMTWNIIRHEGNITPDIYNSNGAGGNIIALKLVMEGLKLQPCRPGFLDSRNAILAADSLLYGYSHKCDIWNAFAQRGMGLSAIQGLSTSTGDQVAAFDVPSGITLNKSSVTSFVNSGSQITYNTTMTCQCQVPAGSYTLTDTIPAGFSYVSSNTGALQGNAVQFAPETFSNSLEVKTLTLTLRATAKGCDITKPLNDDRETNVSGGLISERIDGSTNWVSSQNHSYSGANAWFAADPSSTTNFTLTSGTILPGSLSVLSFWHYFVTEIYLDGGKVEISSNNGSTWFDALPYFLQNGYNGKLNSSAPQPNTFAFTGTSYATGSANNGQFIQSVIDLSSFANQSVKIRFRFQTNNNNTLNQTYDGWYIDDITITNGCGGISKVALLNSTNNKSDSVARPFYIIANSVLPLEFYNFSAKQTGREVWLNWETSAEINTKNFEIERSADGIRWFNIGTVSAKELSKNTYAYTDLNPMDNQNFYRIKINDKDGRFYYTIIKKIEFNSNNVLSIVPNPAIDKVTLYFGTNSKGTIISVSDMKGRLMQQLQIGENTGSYLLPTNKLPSGTYLVRIQSKTGVSTQKLIVAH